MDTNIRRKIKIRGKRALVRKAIEILRRELLTESLQDVANTYNLTYKLVYAIRQATRASRKERYLARAKKYLERVDKATLAELRRVIKFNGAYGGWQEIVDELKDSELGEKIQTRDERAQRHGLTAELRQEFKEKAPSFMKYLDLHEEYPELNQTQLAKKMGVTRSRVNQLAKRARTYKLKGKS